MILLVLVLAAVIAMSGGLLVGYVAGRVHERAITETRRPMEALAQLRPGGGGR